MQTFGRGEGGRARRSELTSDVAVLFRAMSDGLVVAGEAFDDLDAAASIDLFVPMIQAVLRQALAAGGRP